jgi:hypothetical protein
MQILYLIGNGFDVNLNMKTRYTDFYKFYQKIETESDVLKNLKENIKKDVNTWSDLEIRLGEYTENLKSYTEFKEIYEDLLEKFGDYLQETEEQVNWENSNIDKLTDYLCNPENSLMQKEINIIKSFKSEFAKSQWTIDIISFNYTRSIEKLFAENFKNYNLGKHHEIQNIILRTVLHLHGELNNMVLGVNDVSQLKNSNFHKDKKVLNAFIKEYNNKRQGHTVDEILETRISQANLICIFGSSIGETDKIWWEKIGQHLLNNEKCKLIIFTYKEITPKRSIHLKGDFEDETKENFMKNANLNEEEKELIDNRVFVRANTEMFSSLINEKVLEK